MDSPPLHIVAVTGFVRGSDSRILLVKSPKRGWELPGGQVEVGESLIAALRREVFEESTADISIKGLIGIYSNLTADVPKRLIHLFECESDCIAPIPDNEIIEAGWFGEDEALHIVTHEPNLLRLQDALNGFRQYRVYREHPFVLLDSLPL